MIKTILFVVLTLISHQSFAKKDIINCENHKHNDAISLACNLYFEARGEDTIGKWWIVATVLGRVKDKSYPTNISDVIWQITKNKNKKKIPQFSWTLDGASDIPRDQRSWDESLKIAKYFAMNRKQQQQLCPEIKATRLMQQYLGRKVTPVECENYNTYINNKINILSIIGIPSNITSYHSIHVSPDWANRLKLIKVAGLHLFYSK